MRTEELVDRAGQEVGADVLDVDGQVRRGGDGVDVGQGARFVRAANQLAHRVDRPDRVRRPAEGDQLGTPVEGGVESLDVERDIVGPDVDPLDDETEVAGDGLPRTDVRFVVEQVVTMRSPGARVAAIERATCIVSVVMLAPNLISAGSAAEEEVGDRAARLVDDGVAAPAGEERALVIGVRLAVVARDCFDDGVGTWVPPGPSNSTTGRPSCSIVSAGNRARTASTSKGVMRAIVAAPATRDGPNGARQRRVSDVARLMSGSVG